MNSMRDLLRNHLGRSLRTLDPLDRLATAWPVACGQALARRGALAGLEAGTLTIEVDDPAWLEEFRAMEPVLRHQLARIAEVQLAGIHFQRKRRRPLPSRELGAPPSRS